MPLVFAAGVPAWMQYTSLAVLVVVVLAMVFEDQIGIALQVTACIGTCVLVLTGVISEKEALKSIDLKVVLLFGGSPALASALDSTGAGTLIADPSSMIIATVIACSCAYATPIGVPANTRSIHTWQAADALFRATRRS